MDQEKHYQAIESLFSRSKKPKKGRYSAVNVAGQTIEQKQQDNVSRLSAPCRSILETTNPKTEEQAQSQSHVKSTDLSGDIDGRQKRKKKPRAKVNATQETSPSEEKTQENPNYNALPTVSHSAISRQVANRLFDLFDYNKFVFLYLKALL